jgi:DNA-binding MltR family transcriptional regulator
MLEDSATYQFGEHIVTAGKLDYGWWLLHQKGDGPVDTWPTWAVAPNGAIYEGTIELVTNPAITYRPIGPTTMYTIAHLTLLTGSPYKQDKKEVQRVSEFTAMWQSLDRETSDRAVVVIGAAYIDDRLARTLKAFFIARKKPVEELLSIRGALGSFGTRIALAFCLGLIGENEYDDLAIIQKLRNDFAHTAADLTFDTQHIASRCDSLQVLKTSVSPGLFQGYNRRERYIMTVAELVSTLAYVQFLASSKRRTIPSNRDWRHF